MVGTAAFAFFIARLGKVWSPLLNGEADQAAALVVGLAAMPDYWTGVAPHRDRIALLAGADDAKYVAIAEGLPCAAFETIPDSGHDPTLEQPVALAGAIRRAVQALR